MRLWSLHPKHLDTFWRKALLARDREKLSENARAKASAHPIFAVRKGKKEGWERDRHQHYRHAER